MVVTRSGSGLAKSVARDSNDSRLFTPSHGGQAEYDCGVLAEKAILATSPPEPLLTQSKSCWSHICIERGEGADLKVETDLIPHTAARGVSLAG